MEYCPLSTFENISSVLLPVKGAFPHSNKYKIIPMDQTSHFWLYSPLITSGAI